MSQFFAQSTFEEGKLNYLSDFAKSLANSITQDHILKNS